jgi:hypothetical protein
MCDKKGRRKAKGAPGGRRKNLRKSRNHDERIKGGNWKGKAAEKLTRRQEKHNLTSEKRRGM